MLSLPSSSLRPIRRLHEAQLWPDLKHLPPLQHLSTRTSLASLPIPCHLSVTSVHPQLANIAGWPLQVHPSPRTHQQHARHVCPRPVTTCWDIHVWVLTQQAACRPRPPRSRVSSSAAGAAHCSASSVVEFPPAPGTPDVHARATPLSGGKGPHAAPPHVLPVTEVGSTVRPGE